MEALRPRQAAPQGPGPDRRQRRGSAPAKGFECDDNALSVFWREGRHDIAHGPKSRVARDLMALMADRLEARP